MERAAQIATRGAYLRVEEIARGGMGHVDLVLRREASFQRLHAMKRLSPSLRDDEGFRRMFLDEARVAGLLRHPNVVSVLDVGEDEQGPFLVMDFVDGLPLSEIQRTFERAGERIPVQVCLRIAQQIADGLHAAHELRAHDGAALQLVHRDVSPQNVLVGFDGAARLTDFGVAKALGRQSATTVDVLKGKVSYMSPEQLRFQEIDRRSDLFSLGVILFELLANERLYWDPDISKSARRVLDEPPPDVGQVRGDVSDATVELLFDLLCKEREHRPPTAREVSERLIAILDERVAEEGSLSVASFLEERFAERRREEHERRARAVADAEARAIRAAATARRRRLLVAAGATLALGASAALGAWAAGAFGTGGEADARNASDLSRNETALPPAPGDDEEASGGEADVVGEPSANERSFGEGDALDQAAGTSDARTKRPRRRPRRRAAPAQPMEPEPARDRRLWTWE